MNDRLPPALVSAQAGAAIQLEDHERTRCEVWTRVMGYHRPVGEFNAGKQAEHAARRHFIEPVLGGGCSPRAAAQDSALAEAA